MAKEDNEIMERPLPEILNDIRKDHKENKLLIAELRDMFNMLRDLITRSDEATSRANAAAAEAREAGVKAGMEAKKAAAEAREAGLKAAEEAAKAAKEAIEDVRKIAEEARDTAFLIGTALMTAEDGRLNASGRLLESLKTKFEFKK